MAEGFLCHPRKLLASHTASHLSTANGPLNQVFHPIREFMMPSLWPIYARTTRDRSAASFLKPTICPSRNLAHFDSSRSPVDGSAMGTRWLDSPVEATETHGPIILQETAKAQRSRHEETDLTPDRHHL